MTLRANDILNKLMGSGLLLASVAFFSDGSPHSFVPGALFGASGLWLAVRRERGAPRELELERRVDQLTEQLASTQQELGAAQDRLEGLAQERDFMRQLTTPPGAANTPAPTPGAEPAARAAEEATLPRSSGS